MGSIFFELTVIICVSALFATIFRFLKQPLILAYILTGILIGPLGLFHLGNGEVISAMGELGITLLLFILGLELRFSELKEVGLVALVVGFVQVVYTFVLGYLFAQLLGFHEITSVYIGLALMFSSTIIVVKLLSDKKNMNSLYGKISIGVLLFQDFVAIALLMILSGFQRGESAGFFSLYPFLFILIKGSLLFGFVFFLSKRILPRIIDSIAKSQEALFLVSLAFAFGVAGLVSSPLIGFSVEIGGLLAGVALANAVASFQIAAKVRALRDFFITIFFVFLGTQMSFSNIFLILPSVIVLSMVVIFYKPLIVMASLGLFGFRKRTSFFTASSLAQISEFSFILMFLGYKLGHVSKEAVSVITMVGVLSFIVSNYLMLYDTQVYKHIHPFFDLFERKTPQKENIGNEEEFKGHVVLIGAHRVGESILDSLEDLDMQVVVIDFNPDIIRRLKDKKNIHSLFGDISDLDILEKARLHDARLVISTVPDIEDNLLLLKSLKNRRTQIVVLSETVEDAKELYKFGADYVLLPHLLGGRHIAKILKDEELNVFAKLRERDQKNLF
ncbi:MAG: cation:proton antiporter [Candidatus Levybacteria bacterium]|nr:cation:proton antiporter [Candidatus Levybacteria bacterium]